MADYEDIAGVLHEAAETHHTVWRITDGDDPDWASWYADWLLDLSELPALLEPSRCACTLVHALVQLDRDHVACRSTDVGKTFTRRVSSTASHVEARIATLNGLYPVSNDSAVVMIALWSERV